MLGEKMTTVTINGESSDDPLTRISEDVSQFRDTFHIPEVPVYFNTDKVMLPATPTHSRLTRMIMIHNSLEHDVIAYEWMRSESYYDFYCYYSKFTEDINVYAS